MNNMEITQKQIEKHIEPYIHQDLVTSHIDVLEFLTDKLRVKVVGTTATEILIQNPKQESEQICLSETIFERDFCGKRLVESVWNNV